MAEDEESQPQEPKKLALPDAPGDEGRRTLMKVAVVASGLLAAGAAGSIVRTLLTPPSSAASTTAPTSFPRVKLANVSDLTVGTPIVFYYPLTDPNADEPNVLVKLGEKAVGGVGPDGDIVAFSLICQHLGCIYGFLPRGTSPPCDPQYNAPKPVGYCCCHGSIYDFTNAASVVGGPSPRPQPQVTLEVDSTGAIYATGMGPPTVFGHNTGSNDVSYDLQG
jgi:arsenite oxidase small subunit